MASLRKLQSCVQRLPTSTLITRRPHVDQVNCVHACARQAQYTAKITSYACASVSFHRRCLSTTGAAVASDTTDNVASAGLLFSAEKEIADLQKDVAQAIREGEYQRAYDMAVDCVSKTATYVGLEHPAYACAVNNVALSLNHLGKTVDAIQQLEEALKVYEKCVGPSHVSTAAVLANLGVFHSAVAVRSTGMEKLGHADAAHAYLERALSVRKTCFPPHHPLISITMYQLAAPLRLRGKHSEAEKLLKEAIGSLRKSVGSGHTATATALNNYGFFLKETKRLEEAADAYSEALSLRCKLLGESHADTVATMNNVAELLFAQGKEPEGLAMQQRILQVLGVKNETKP